LPNINDNKFSFKSCFKIAKPQNILIDKNLFEKINKFTEKNSITIPKGSKYEEKKEEYDYKEFIKPVIKTNQSSSLRNMNDYHIKESYNVDEDRFIKHSIKQKNNYDIVSHTKNNFENMEIKVDKWPKYYEK
jgi:hypothetical protein